MRNEIIPRFSKAPAITIADEKKLSNSMESWNQEAIQRYHDALFYAAVQHQDQRRKGAKLLPYINHPIEVALLLVQAGVTDVEVVIAGLLHDTVEDTTSTIEEIRKRFGNRVADIVLECSDDKKLSKETRKRLQLEHAKMASKEAKLVKLADKFSNLRDLLGCPPRLWSTDEIEGYAVWVYAVVNEMKGTNTVFDNQFSELFQKFKIHELVGKSPTDLQNALHKYYACMDKSK